jgi:uncharacterized protein
MLLVNVSQLLKGPVGSVRRVPIDDEVEVTGCGTSNASGEAELTKTNRSILVRADVEMEVKLECARCLESYTCPLRLHFEEEYFPMTDVQSGVPIAEPEEPEAFIIDENLTLDLGEAIRQYALTALPMKPLCRTGCPGISLPKKNISI